MIISHFVVPTLPHLPPSVSRVVRSYVVVVCYVMLFEIFLFLSVHAERIKVEVETKVHGRDKWRERKPQRDRWEKGFSPLDDSVK
jgi:hypothetical protein